MREKSQIGHLFCKKSIYQHQNFTVFSWNISGKKKWQTSGRQKEL